MHFRPLASTDNNIYNRRDVSPQTFNGNENGDSKQQQSAQSITRASMNFFRKKSTNKQALRHAGSKNTKSTKKVENCLCFYVGTRSSSISKLQRI
jgi:hypothetical protein